MKTHVPIATMLDTVGAIQIGGPPRKLTLVMPRSLIQYSKLPITSCAGRVNSASPVNKPILEIASRLVMLRTIHTAATQRMLVHTG